MALQISQLAVAPLSYLALLISGIRPCPISAGLSNAGSARHHSFHGGTALPLMTATARIHYGVYRARTSEGREDVRRALPVTLSMTTRRGTLRADLRNTGPRRGF